MTDFYSVLKGYVCMYRKCSFTVSQFLFTSELYICKWWIMYLMDVTCVGGKTMTGSQVGEVSGRCLEGSWAWRAGGIPFESGSSRIIVLGRLELVRCEEVFRKWRFPFWLGRRRGDSCAVRWARLKLDWSNNIIDWLKNMKSDLVIRILSYCTEIRFWRVQLLHYRCHGI